MVRTAPTPAALAALGLAATLWLTGCGSSAGASTGTSGRPSTAGATADNDGGGPLPAHRAGETYPGERATSTVDVDLAANGCWFVVLDGTRRMAVWPAGAVQDPQDGTAVLLPGGVRVVDGNRLAVTAGPVAFTDLAGFPDGYWGSQVLFCDPKGEAVLVMDSAALV